MRLGQDGEYCRNPILFIGPYIDIDPVVVATKGLRGNLLRSLSHGGLGDMALFQEGQGVIY